MNGSELDPVQSYQPPNGRSLSGTLTKKGCETAAACAAAFTSASFGPCATSRLPSSATHSPAKRGDSLASHSSSALPSSTGSADAQFSGRFRFRQSHELAGALPVQGVPSGAIHPARKPPQDVSPWHHYCTGCQDRCGSDPRLLSPFDDQLSHNRPRRFLEPICASRFLQPSDPLTCKLREQSGQCRTSDDHIMRGENRPYFVVAALGIKKLAPGEHIRPLQENNLESGLSFGPNCFAVALSIDRNRVHGVAPF
jgi:hypothetical protein